jgi:hypothetical protein
MLENAPSDAVEAMNEYCRVNLTSERKEGMTEEQFLYSARKKAIGPLKRQWWDLDEAAQQKIGNALEEQFAFLFEKLNVKDTRDYAIRTTTTERLHRPRPQSAVQEQALEIASDLSD